MSPEGRTLVGMVSCVERRTERVATLKQLQDANIPRPVVQENTCQPASVEQQLENSLVLVRAAADNQRNLLFVEDDIDCKPEFREWLGVAEYDDVLVTFCVIKPAMEKHIKAPARKPVPPGLYALPRSVGFVGAQALFIPHRLLAPIAAFAVGMVDSLDTVLHYFVKESGEAMHVAYPNPVQHRNPPKMRPVLNDRPLANRQSRSYGREPNIPIARLLEVRRSRWRERTTRPTSP